MTLSSSALHWSENHADAAADVLKKVEYEGIETIRLSFPDQHGILRGKTVIASSLSSAFRGGVRIASSLLMKDTSHKTVFSVFSEENSSGMEGVRGAADMLMVPDPQTFKILPWASKAGWMLCDLYYPDGRKVPFSVRHIYRDALARLEARHYLFKAGLEVEFHLMRLENDRLGLADAGQPGAPSEVSLTHRGFNYLTEQNYDQVEPIMDILRANLQAIGMDISSLEIEFGPSQVEIVFNPALGLRPADDMVLFRSAVKQICRRHGYHATFMCRPRLEHVMSSGWHLHQSLLDVQTGKNAFIATDDEYKSGKPLSQAGMMWLGGLLTHAAEGSVFATPTINGYKRYRPLSLAPDRITWGEDNRGAMLRVIAAAADPASRIENRAGEPAANPYLYLSGQIIAGMDGLDKQIDPGPSADSPYVKGGEKLPRNLRDAIGHFRASTLFRSVLGDAFVDYLSQIKTAEIERYEQDVSEWEQREYFDIF